MSDLGAFIKDIRAFCAQAAAILNQADAEMAEHGWSLAQSSQLVFANNSAVLASPRRWFPSELFRFYRYIDGGQQLAFVSLLLDDDPENSYSLEQPLATAGLLHFREPYDSAAYVVSHYWWSRFYGYVKNDWRGHGEVVQVSTDLWADERERHPDWYPFDRISTFGIPLAEFTAAEIVTKRLLQPLLGLATRA